MIKFKQMRNLLYLLLVLFVFSACEDFLDPKLSDEKTYEQLLKEPLSVSLVSEKRAL